MRNEHGDGDGEESGAEAAELATVGCCCRRRRTSDERSPLGKTPPAHTHTRAFHQHADIRESEVRPEASGRARITCSLTSAGLLDPDVYITDSHVSNRPYPYFACRLSPCNQTIRRKSVHLRRWLSISASLFASVASEVKHTLECKTLRNISLNPPLYFATTSTA